jgi:hypothetical protein
MIIQFVIPKLIYLDGFTSQPKENLNTLVYQSFMTCVSVATTPVHRGCSIKRNRETHSDQKNKKRLESCSGLSLAHYGYQVYTNSMTVVF